MKAGFKAVRRGFTLVELMVAMAITAMLVAIIMQLTSQGIALWRAVQQDVSTSARARVALRTIAHDLESFQMKGSGNQYQWFASKVDSSQDNRRVADKLDVPRSSCTVFFACAPDRNPAVSSKERLRANYRIARDSNPETQGDVNTIGYHLVYRDHILRKDGDSRDDGTFPVFSLYRHVVSPRETFDKYLCRTGKNTLMKDFDSAEFKKPDDKNFLCEDILEMAMSFNLEYTEEKGGKIEYKTVSVPVISSRGGSQELNVYGDRIEVGNKIYKNARIVSADISITVLTEDGVNLVEQVRQGMRRPPQREAFLSAYTRSYSRTVMLPQPI